MTHSVLNLVLENIFIAAAHIPGDTQDTQIFLSGGSCSLLRFFSNVLSDWLIVRKVLDIEQGAELVDLVNGLKHQSHIVETNTSPPLDLHHYSSIVAPRNVKRLHLVVIESICLDFDTIEVFHDLKRNLFLDEDTT